MSWSHAHTLAFRKAVDQQSLERYQSNGGDYNLTYRNLALLQRWIPVVVTHQLYSDWRRFGPDRKMLPKILLFEPGDIGALCEGPHGEWDTTEVWSGGTIDTRADPDIPGDTPWKVLGRGLSAGTPIEKGRRYASSDARTKLVSVYSTRIGGTVSVPATWCLKIEGWDQPEGYEPAVMNPILPFTARDWTSDRPKNAKPIQQIRCMAGPADDGKKIR